MLVTRNIKPTPHPQNSMRKPGPKTCCNRHYLKIQQPPIINSLNKQQHKKQEKHKKPYCQDTGLINSVSNRFSENRDRLLENPIRTALKRENKEIYHHTANYECDFLIKDSPKITCALQTTLSLQNNTTRKKEIRMLLEAMKAHKLDKSTIIYEKESDVLVIGDKTIRIDPIYKWLMHSVRGWRRAFSGITCMGLSRQMMGVRVRDVGIGCVVGEFGGWW